MTLILLRFFLKKIQLECSNCHYYFLLLIFMFYSKSTTSQVVSDFTTINLNTGCGSLVVEFEDLSTGNPDTWLWDFGNGNSSSQQNPIAVYSSPGLYTVKLTVSDASTQDVHIETDFVKVYAQPTVSLDQNSTLFCVPEEVLFTDETQSANNIVAWMWDFGDGGSSNLQNPIYEYQNNGVFTVSLSVVDDKGCESLVIFDNLIDAKKVPVSDFVSDIDFSCNSTELVTFTNNSEFAYSYFWNFGDGTTSSNTNPTHNYNSGVFDVYLVSDNSVCTDTLFLNNLIEIGGVMTTDFTSNVNSICEFDSVSFSDETLNSADTWFWDFGDGNTSSLQNPIHQYTSGGNYTVTLSTNKNGSCLSEEIKVNFIEVFDSPSIDFYVNNQISCNPPLIVDFYDNTLNITDWFWEMENGFMSTNQNPVVNFTDSGSFDVTLTVIDDNGCSSIKTKSDFIKIDDFSADFNVSDSIICEDDFVDFLDNTNSIFNITSYNWDFGDGNTSLLQNPQNQYLGINTFDVSLIIENSIGCTDQKSISSFIKTVGPPTADFVADNLISCAGSSINFTDLTSSPAAINNYNWSFGDGNNSSVQNPVYQYNMLGIFDVELIVGDGKCVDTIVKTNYIEIIKPLSYFKDKHNCQDPLSVEFYNYSIGADNVFWDFGDGNTSTDYEPIHNYIAEGIYQVTLSVTNNATLCSHEFVQQIDVSSPNADFTYLVNTNNSFSDSVVCLPKKRSHVDVLSDNLRNYKIDWGDGYVGINRSDHLYSSIGLYDVTLMMTDNYGCKDTLVYNDMFRVTEVETDFTTSNVQGCNDLSVDFEDLSSVTSSVFWDFGDGNSSTQNNPTNVYLLEGIYDVTLFSTSIEGCLDTLVRQEYIVFEKPILNFTFSDNAICKDETVVFVDSSKGLSLDYNWDFGDGNTSVLKSPQHNYQNVGSFPVSLTITDTFGCTVVNNTELIEVQNVQVDFSSNLLSSNCPPLISTFTNNSSGVNLSYNWSFGDGLTSSQENPSHLYSTSGDFDVRLIIEDNFSCKDTLVMSNMISIFGPMGTFNYSSDVVCKSDSVVFTANVQNVDSYLWDFGDGIFSTDSNPSHLYSNGDFYSPQLVIENTSACQLIVTSDDSIEVIEIIVDAGINQTICLGDSISLLAIGSATNYNWISSQNIINENSQIPIVFPQGNEMFYVVNSDGLCEGIDSVIVEVDNNIPIPTFITNNHCVFDSMSLIVDEGIIASSFTYEWNILGENLYTQTSNFQFDSVGIFPIEVIVTNLDNNCDASVIQNIEILPLPVVSFVSDKVCLGEKTNFTNLSSPDITGSLWSFGDGFQSSFDMNPTCQFSTSGMFNTTLIVSSSDGCLNKITKEVEVFELPELESSISTQCLGSETEFKVFTQFENSEIQSYSWNFGDDSEMSDHQFPTHNYSNYGEYNVIVAATTINGCKSEIQNIAKVNPVPFVDFDVIRICEGDNTQFINNSSIVEGTILYYNWNFLDGNSSDYLNPSNTFSSFGTYNVNLEVESSENCISNLSKEIQIHETPNANFLVDNEICENTDVKFVNTSISDGLITSYNWDFGNRDTSSDQNPITTYNHSGIYSITLSIENEFSCSNSIIKDSFITVAESPIASFNMSDNRVSLLSSDVLFVNTSDENLFFEWDFDNGVIDSENKDISISFENPGNYDVLLYVENDFGCSDEVIHSVQVDDEFNVFVPTAFTPNNDGLNDVFEVKGNGVSTFQIRIYNRWGGLVFFSDNLEIGWNGIEETSGEVLDNGTYLYNIHVTDYNKKLWVYNGELNLMK